MPRYKIETYYGCKSRCIRELIDLHSRTFNTDPSSVRVSRQYTSKGYCLFGGGEFDFKPVDAFITADIEFKGSQEEWREYCFKIVKIFRDSTQIRDILLPSRPDLEFTIDRLEGTPLEKVRVKRKGKFPKKEWADEISERGQQLPKLQYLDLQVPNLPEDGKKRKDKEKNSSKPSKTKQLDVVHLPEDDKHNKEKIKDKNNKSQHLLDQFLDLPDIPGSRKGKKEKSQKAPKVAEYDTSHLPEETRPKKGKKDRSEKSSNLPDPQRPDSPSPLKKPKSEAEKKDKDKKSSKLAGHQRSDYSSSDFDVSEKSKHRKEKSSDKEMMGKNKSKGDKYKEPKDSKKDKKKRKKVKFDPKDKTSEAPHWADAGDDTFLSSLYEDSDDQEEASNSEPCCEDGDAAHKVEYREEEDTSKKTPCCDYGR